MIWQICMDSHMIEIFQSFGCDDEADFKKTQLDDLAKNTVKKKL